MTDMARVDVTTQQISRAGLVPSMTAPTADGDVFDSGPTILVVENTGTSAHSVTVQSPLTVDGLDVEELTVSVAAGDQVLIGPFPQRTFGQPSSSADVGRVYANYGATPADFLRAVVSLQGVV